MADQIHSILILQLTVLLILANGSPVVAKRIFGERFSNPIDGGLVLDDQRPLFGPSKTIRGLLASVVATVGSVLIGPSLAIGALVALAAMAGDIFSSFLKRRFGLPASSRVTGLDQIPEALLPVAACALFLPLSILDIVLAVAIFSVLEIAISPLLHSIRIRDEPY
jgi:CDP-2,3-bis-(O-geranylgeranyl)-sn-glycerol synthase